MTRCENCHRENGHHGWCHMTQQQPQQQSLHPAILTEGARSQSALDKTTSLIAQLSLTTKMLASSMVLLDIAKRDLGAAAIQNGNGTIVFDAHGLSVDSFYVENRMGAVVKRDGSRHLAQSLGS